MFVSSYHVIIARCEFESHSGNAALCDKVCQWLVAGRWVSPGTPVFSTNKTDCHDITEILLKVETRCHVGHESKQKNKKISDAKWRTCITQIYWIRWLIITSFSWFMVFNATFNDISVISDLLLSSDVFFFCHGLKDLLFLRSFESSFSLLHFHFLPITIRSQPWWPPSISAILWRENIIYIKFVNNMILTNKTYLCI
jgi:hypothetical protein